MIELPKAKLYVLCPVENPKVVITIGDIRPCGNDNMTFSQLLMNEMATVMTPEDITGYTGLNGERCLVLVNFSEEHANKLLDGALVSIDELFQEKPELIPEGGVFMVQ